MSEPKKVLLVHPYLAPPGGGEGLAAYVLQADNFTLYQVSPWLTWLLERQPAHLRVLRDCVLEVFVKRLAQRQSFDLYFSAFNELTKMDAVLRDPGLQMDLYRQALRQQELFTAESFVREMQESVRQFMQAPASPLDVSSAVSPG